MVVVIIDVPSTSVALVVVPGAVVMIAWSPVIYVTMTVVIAVAVVVAVVCDPAGVPVV